MKSIFNIYLFSACLLFHTSSVFSQGLDSLIEINTEIGRTIGTFDNQYYGLFNQIEGFQKAELFIRDNKYLVSKIFFFSQNKMLDTILVQPLAVLDSLRLQVNLIQEEYDDKLDFPVKVKIKDLIGNKYEGELEMFSKQYFYLYSEDGIITHNTSHLRVKIPVSDIESIVVFGGSKVLSSMGWGALAGFILGVYGSTDASTQSSGLLGKGDMDDFTYSTCMGLLGASAGAFYGLIVGLILPSSEELIEFNSIYDLIKLKEYVKYNPGDKSPPGAKYFQVESL
jgi:hypothetical protein